MTTFFKPLRRKIGVLTLGLACVFMAGWARSFFWEDAIIFDSGSDWVDSLAFGNGWICLGSVLNKDYQQASPKYPFPKWHSRRIPIRDQQIWLTTPSSEIWGFTVRSNKYVVSIEMPLLLPAIALTLLSSYLLLSRPRATKPVPPVAENA